MSKKKKEKERKKKEKKKELHKGTGKLSSLTKICPSRVLGYVVGGAIIIFLHLTFGMYKVSFFKRKSG